MAPFALKISENSTSELVAAFRKPPLKTVSEAASDPEPVFLDLLRSPGIDCQPGGPVRQPYLLYRTAKLHGLAESISRYRFPGSLNVYKYGL
jgi:hypothetical protein